MILKIIKIDTLDYKKMVELRTQILRIPLGLSLSQIDLEMDKEDILMGYFDDSSLELIACCILTKIDTDIIKLRQMAVGEKWQGQGFGKSLILYAEGWAKNYGFKKIVLNARKVSSGFYQTLGYRVTGDEFIEVNIPHIKMKKNI